MDAADVTLELAAATLTDAGIDADAPPDERIGGDAPEGVYERRLHAMFDALPPLPVDHGEGPESGVVEVVGRLGQGGMGVVELAVQRPLGREVALKRMIEAPSHPRKGYSLLDEARILGGLEHPNIVPVHAVGLDRELGPVVLLKRVQGEVWSDALRSDAAQLPEDRRALETHLRIFMQVCNAAHFAHSRRVIHRDIKPANVMLGGYGEVYLLDWGLALDGAVRDSSPNRIAGTVSYMAPEMAAGDPAQIDGQTDVYLLGATLHSVLMGTPRHRSQNIYASLVKAVLSEPFEYPDHVPAALAAICNRACALDKADRYASAEALRDAVGNYLEERELHALLDAAGDALDALEPESDQAAQRLHEARFATDQALRLRPAFAAAKRMRRRCTFAGIDYELARGNLAGARDYLSQTGDDGLPDALADRLAQAEAEAEAEAVRIARMERDRDPEASRAGRLRYSSFALLSIPAYHATVFALFRDRPMSPTELLVAGLAFFGPMALAGAFAARAMRETSVGRQFAWVLVSASTVVFLTRLMGVAGGLSEAVVLGFETAMFGTVALSVDIALGGRLVVATVSLGSALLAVGVPEWARVTHSAVTLICGVVILADNLVPRSGQREPSTPAEDASDAS